MEGIGGKHGWAWIFIIVRGHLALCIFLRSPLSADHYSRPKEGLFTTVFGVVSFFVLPRTPSDTPFLNEQDKVYINEALVAGGIIAKDEADDEFSWSQVRRAFTQVHVLLMAVAGFASGIFSRLRVCGRPMTNSFA